MRVFGGAVLPPLGPAGAFRVVMARLITNEADGTFPRIPFRPPHRKRVRMPSVPSGEDQIPTFQKTLASTGGSAPSQAPEPVAPSDPPAHAERYALGAEIARGGMGTIVHAFDRLLD